jgi:hypothetical protein
MYPFLGLLYAFACDYIHTKLELIAQESDPGYKVANAAAQRAARQQPKATRSASLSFVKHAVKEKWKTTTKLNKYIQDARKSVATRYLQLKSNHAVTGVHLLRINKVQDARC